MKPIRQLFLAGLGAIALAAPATASDLRVAPVIVAPLPGSETATITLSNEGKTPAKAQIRVMHWQQQDGKETLTPADHLVASPPFVTLQPGQSYLVRLVHTGEPLPAGEDSYRVLVDELPEPGAAQPGTVNLVVRQSLPAFFSKSAQRTPNVDWQIVKDGNKLWLTADNSGNRRLRLSDLSLTINGQQIYHQSGLVGYVLADSEMRWPIAPTAPIDMNQKVQMEATADTGPLHALLQPKPGA